jgi:hypothetical protein
LNKNTTEAIKSFKMWFVFISQHYARGMDDSTAVNVLLVFSETEAA